MEMKYVNGRVAKVGDRILTNFGSPLMDTMYVSEITPDGSAVLLPYRDRVGTPNLTHACHVDDVVFPSGTIAVMQSPIEPAKDLTVGEPLEESTSLGTTPGVVTCSECKGSGVGPHDTVCKICLGSGIKKN